MKGREHVRFADIERFLAERKIPGITWDFVLDVNTCEEIGLNPFSR